MRETTKLRVEIMNRKRQAQEETWSRGTNSRLPFDVTVMLNLSNNQDKPESNPTVQFERTQFQAHAQTQMAIFFFSVGFISQVIASF